MIARLCRRSVQSTAALAISTAWRLSDRSRWPTLAVRLSLQCFLLDCRSDMKTWITAARLFTPTETIDEPLISVEDGIIHSVGARSSAEIPEGAQHLDFPDLVIAPGFIDIHVHGGAGHDVMQDDPSGRVAFEKAMAKRGVT